MPRLASPLSDTTVKNLKPKDKRYSRSDGGGLIIEVLPSGAKTWRYRYTLYGRQQAPVTIGPYPQISLKEARLKAIEYGTIVAMGESPVEQSKRDRGIVKPRERVKEFALEWYDTQIAKLSDSYATNTKRVLEKDVFPVIGNKPLDRVTPKDVLQITDAIKARGSDQSALFVRNTLKRMFDYGIGRHEMKGPNPAAQVPARFIAKQESRKRVLEKEEIGRLLRQIYQSNMGRPNKLAVHLLVITMVRKAELIGAEWSELDLDESIWRIPGTRMKKDVDHWVYLPRQAVAMFKELRSLATHERFVFPSNRLQGTKPIAKSTLNQAIRAMMPDIQHFVIHDFRRTASTHLNESDHLLEPVVEKALAHATGGVKGVYNRALYSEQRKAMLQKWADFVDEQIRDGLYVPLG